MHYISSRMALRFSAASSSVMSPDFSNWLSFFILCSMVVSDVVDVGSASIAMVLPNMTAQLSGVSLRRFASCTNFRGNDLVSHTNDCPELAFVIA